MSRISEFSRCSTFLDMWWVILKSIQSLGPECLASKSFSLVKDLRKRLLCWGQMPRGEVSEKYISGKTQEQYSVRNKSSLFVYEEKLNTCARFHLLGSLGMAEW